MEFILWFAFAVCAADVPRVWDGREVESLQLPVPNSGFARGHISEAEYYQVPERSIYKSYPVYAPGREPEGYQEWLKTREAEIAFDSIKLHSSEEWIGAGEVVFNWPLSLSPMFFSAQDLRDPEFLRSTGMPVAKDGTIPFARWVVRRKGVVELGTMSCATCHTRVLSDGAVLPGAQGNNPNDRQGALLLRRGSTGSAADAVLQRVRAFAVQFEAPWAKDDPNRLARSMSLNQFIEAGLAAPPGVSVRANTSLVLPPQIPDLIGVRERVFLDHTGIVRHRKIGDLMRYTTLAQDFFVAEVLGEGGTRRMPSQRYSDAQLYALSLYLYSLRPPENPNPFDAAAQRGKRLFEREACSRCHAPPLYTNNKLIPVEGFEPGNNPDVGGPPIGVDPRYALDSRKATGFYKVPSLKGVWYRGPLGHHGSAATLEDWFDPARLRTNYVPTGFKGIDGRQRSIPGHLFGLKLSAQERKDLITFLRTL
jgi:hypothetical protein